MFKEEEGGVKDCGALPIYLNKASRRKASLRVPAIFHPVLSFNYKKITKRMEVNKSYKIRLYPNIQQEEELRKILKGCRFVWNYFLEKRQKLYLDEKKSISYLALSKEMTKLRKSSVELKGVQLTPLQQTLRRLDRAYNHFFKKVSKFPRFKKEWDTKQSFQKSKDWKIIDRKIRLQKNLILKCRGQLPQNVEKIGTIIVSLVAGRWYASIVVKEVLKTPKRYSKPIGLDVGMTSLVITSDGKKYNALKPSYDAHPKMRALQQKMARQEIGSKRREETRQQIARLYHKLSNIRMNHIHQNTHAILKKNPSLIAIEDLAVANMVKNRHLSRSLMDISLGELLRQLEYKQKWRGGEVFKIGRFFPSTKTCSKCGYINQEMNLGTRIWDCIGCGEKHDRDINAAKNILQQAIGRGTASVESAIQPA
jgi:putative transposase